MVGIVTKPSTIEKLNILSADAKYDLACACSADKDEHRQRGGDSRWLYPVNPQDSGPLDVLINKLKTIEPRAKRENTTIQLEKIVLPVAPIELVAKKIERTANKRLRTYLAHMHMIRMCDEYLKNNTPEAREHADFSLRYNSEPDALDATNIGYLFLAIDDIEKAKSLLKNAVQKKDDTTFPLAAYDLGMLEAKLDNLSAGFEKLGLNWVCF